MKRHLILAALLTIGAANLNAASPKKTAPEQKGVETINRATAEAHIEFLACDELEGREAGWKGGRIAGNYIISCLKQMGLQPLFDDYVQPFEVCHAERQIKNKRWQVHPDSIAALKKTVHQKLDLRNILAKIEGKNPNEIVVIGAHYDHLGHGGSGSLAPNSNEIHHGADDNASGTAAVIQIAQDLAKAKNNARTIVFLAFSGEEEGLYGSNWYVNHPTVPISNIIAMINLDMVGRLDQAKLTIGGIGTAAEWKQLVEKYAVRPGDPAETPLFHLQLNEEGFGPSDHSSFYSKKIPVLFLFTGTHSDYHKPSDTADKINYDGEFEIIRYIERLIGAIDRNAKRPTYEVARSAPTVRTAFNVSLGTVPNYAETSDGLHLDAVRDGSPADKAGVKGGDIVIKLAGKEVRNISDYMFALGEMKAGETYDIVVRRGDKTLTLKIVPMHAGAR